MPERGKQVKQSYLSCFVAAAIINHYHLKAEGSVILLKMKSIITLAKQYVCVWVCVFVHMCMGINLYKFEMWTLSHNHNI